MNEKLNYCTSPGNVIYFNSVRDIRFEILYSMLSSQFAFRLLVKQPLCLMSDHQILSDEQFGVRL
jgi:hypothetical protein